MAVKRDGPVTAAVLCGVQFVDVLGVTSTTTALPVMVDDLSAPEWATGVLATVYAAFFGAFLIVGARLGDRHGHRRILLGGLVVFTVAGAAGWLAPEVWTLAVARGLQGVAAAVSVPTGLRLLLHITEETPRRTGAVAAWGASGAVAGALGFLAGGFLTATLGWRAVMGINVPIGLVLLALVFVRVREAPPVPRISGVDWPGAGSLVAGVMALVVGMSLTEQPAGPAVGSLVAIGGVGLLVAWSRRQCNSATPLVPREAVRSTRLRQGAVLAFVNTATTSSTAVLLVLALQRDLGVGPLQAGLYLLPLSLSVVVGSGWAKPLAGRWPMPRLGGLGLALIAASNVVLGVRPGSGTVVIVAVAVCGLGLGVAAVTATTWGTDVHPDLAGVAGGINNTGAQLGTAIGVAAFVALASATSFSVAVWAIAATASAAALWAATLPVASAHSGVRPAG